MTDWIEILARNLAGEVQTLVREEGLPHRLFGGAGSVREALAEGFSMAELKSAGLAVAPSATVVLTVLGLQRAIQTNLLKIGFGFIADSQGKLITQRVRIIGKCAYPADARFLLAEGLNKGAFGLISDGRGWLKVFVTDL